LTYTIKELARVLHQNPNATIITSTPERRGDIGRAYALQTDEKFRHSRWYGGHHFKMLDRILTKEEFDESGITENVYFDKDLN